MGETCNDYVIKVRKKRQYRDRTPYLTVKSTVTARPKYASGTSSPKTECHFNGKLRPQRVKSSKFVRVKAFPMYGGIGVSTLSLHRESTDSLMKSNT